MAAQLGKTGEILFKSGGTSLSASSAALVPGNWVQYTLVCDNGRATAMINGAEAASGQLAAIPADAGEFTIGGGYSGRIDEIRLWKAVLADRYDRFIFNTINRWNPQWDDLHVYYKMDQDGCANLVDYKVIEAAEAPEFNNHGIMSASGVRRVSAADNTAMPVSDQQRVHRKLALLRPRDTPRAVSAVERPDHPRHPVDERRPP